MRPARRATSAHNASAQSILQAHSTRPCTTTRVRRRRESDSVAINYNAVILNGLQERILDCRPNLSIQGYGCRAPYASAEIDDHLRRAAQFQGMRRRIRVRWRLRARRTRVVSPSCRVPSKRPVLGRWPDGHAVGSTVQLLCGANWGPRVATRPASHRGNPTDFRPEAAPALPRGT